MCKNSVTQLYKRFCNNDEDALRDFYRKKGKCLYTYLHIINKSSLVRTDELLNDTIQRLWQDCKNYKGQEITWSYLCQKAKWVYQQSCEDSLDRKIYKAYCKNKNYTSSSSIKPLGQTSLDNNIEDKDMQSPEQLLEKKQISELNKQAFYKLSTAHREILHLYGTDKYTHEEMGRILGIKKETVKSRLRYAKQELARLLRQKTDHIKGSFYE